MSATVSTSPAQAAPRHHRRIRNYLLDQRFQLKYAGFLVSIAIVLSVSLGALLWSVSREVIRQSEETVRQGQETVQRGQEVVRESQKVSAVVHMNIVKDPVYSQNPELAAVFNESAREQDKRLQDQQQRLEAEAAALERRASAIAHQQRIMFAGLFVVLSLLVLAIGVAGVVFTHKVAGPIFKMKKLLAHVGAGHLVVREKLRKGDELKHFFDAFEKMVESLRVRQQAEIDELDRAIDALVQSEASTEQIAPLRDLRAQMQAALDA